MNFNIDEILEEDKYLSSFIDKDDILKSYSQEDIFSIIFKEIDITKKYLSPFRKDKNPDCSFFISTSGELKFRDFAAGKTYNCFDAIKTYFKLNNFTEVLNLIKNKDIKSTTVTHNNILKYKEEKQKFSFKVYIRKFNYNDKLFWNKFKISKQNLLDDMVYPVEEAILLNTRKGNIKLKFNTLAYLYIVNNRKKLYIPNNPKGKKFISENISEDFIGLEKINYLEEYIVITKSYKDWRVLFNLKFNCIGVQAEGIYDINKLINILINFKIIIVFFDNDEPGKNLSKKLNKLLIENNLNSKEFFINEIYKVKDPSDFIYKYKDNKLIDMLNDEIRKHSSEL